MIRVAIVGCGKMADQHALQIRKISNATIVAACDAEPLMAKQLAERFRIPSWFTDVDQMLAAAHPDVVHVTTPPQSHLQVGRACVQAGVNAYIEKPFTLNTAEALELIELANEKNVKLTAGHNGQFTHAMCQMRGLVDQGFLGDAIVHMESMYCYELGDAAYAKAFLGDRDHWLRKLPGSLLQNTMSHGVSRIAELMKGDKIIVNAQTFSSPFLRRIGYEDIVDELRLTVQDEYATTATFTFSSQIAPAQHWFRVYGSKGSLIVDDDHQVVLRLDNKEYRSHVRCFVPPLVFARQYIRALSKNLVRFANNDFHLPNDAGLVRLIRLFYKAVAEDLAPPIAYREIILTSRIMDAVLEQIGPRQQKTAFSDQATTVAHGCTEASTRKPSPAIV